MIDINTSGGNARQNEEEDVHSHCEYFFLSSVMICRGKSSCDAEFPFDFLVMAQIIGRKFALFVN